VRGFALLSQHPGDAPPCNGPAGIATATESGHACATGRDGGFSLSGVSAW
jgi:hypothetical protein